jgi:hypothetical protein
MQLNEIIENNTLEQISRRTRLTQENLEKLFANNFKGFTKVQALGFISILEREYRVELDSLRDKCLEYFSEKTNTQDMKNKPIPRAKVSEEPPVIAAMNIPKQVSKYTKPTIIGLIAIALLYAAWQTFSSGMQTPSAADRQQDAGFFSSIINQTKTWMNSNDDTPTLDTKTPQDAPKGWADKKETDKNSFLITEQSKKPSEDKKSNDEKIADEENEIIKSVKAQQVQDIKEKKKQSPLNTVEENTPSNEVPAVSNSTVLREEKAAKEQAKIEELASQKEADELAKKKKLQEDALKKAAEEKALQEKAAKEKAAKTKAAEKAAKEKAAKLKSAKEKAAKEAARKRAKAIKAKLAKEKAAKIAKAKAAKLKAAKAKALKAKLVKEKAAKAKTAKEKALKNAKFVIRPSQSIWFGIVDLKTMSRRTYTGTGVAAFSRANGRWIVATSHGHFTFKAGSRVVKFNDSRKHYLIIQKGNIHEIPHATFQKLNKSKAW